MRTENTIAALATAPAPAGIAIVRISGSLSRTALSCVFASREDPILHPRRLIHGEITDPESKDVLDSAMAVFMPGPNSYTGEDTAEIHLHGSPVLTTRVLRILYSLNVAPAGPGEFTERAFLNGKMDLVQAEAVCDLINASSEKALSTAAQHLKGKLSRLIEDLAEPLRTSLAEIEASLDFSDEDISPESTEEIKSNLEKVGLVLNELIDSYTYGHVIREGFRVLICGPPNVGKSTLLNQLLKKDRAIVTEVSGTTRDLIEESVQMAGLLFVFCDSAGLTETSDKVEKIGVQLALDRLEWADLILFTIDLSRTDSLWEQALKKISYCGKEIWLTANKLDLVQEAEETGLLSEEHHRQFVISAKTGQGMDSLKRALTDKVSSNNYDATAGSTLITNERHRNCLSQAKLALIRCINTIDRQLPPEITSSELRLALSALEELVGKTSPEDILDRIFSKFCIGK